MNSREIEQLEKKSIYSIRVNNDLKESVIQNYLNELNKVIKTNLKKRRVIVYVIEEKIY
jgi:hypothetical protein